MSLRQIPIAVSLILLTAALVAMWSSFTSIGLGLRFRRSDALLLIVILALVPSIFSLRENMNDARSVYPLIRHLQSSSPLLLAAPALVALVLHRISQEMGSGQLAISLRFLVASLVLRLLALMVAVSPALASIKAVAAISSAVFFAAPFMFV
jgi:FtsH-binding integral membrane protein